MKVRLGRSHRLEKLVVHSPSKAYGDDAHAGGLGRIGRRYRETEVRCAVRHQDDDRDCRGSPAVGQYLILRRSDAGPACMAVPPNTPRLSMDSLSSS